MKRFTPPTLAAAVKSGDFHRTQKRSARLVTLKDLPGFVVLRLL